MIYKHLISSKVLKKYLKLIFDLYLMEANTINSIQELLTFFKQTTTKIFSIGPFFSTRTVCLGDYIPTYEMITCCDPFKGALPFIKVLQCFQQHTCVGIDCQNIILRQQSVIKYLKSKDQHANIILVIPDPQAERLCKEYGFNYWVTPMQFYGALENKVKIVELLKKTQIPFIPNILSKIQSYQQLQQITKDFGTSKIVVQDENGVGGIGTMFIFNYSDYNSFKPNLQNGKVFKIAAFRNLKPFQISAVATSAGTFVGPLVADMIGHEQLTPYPAGYCGNQARNSYFEDVQINLKVHHQISKYARKFGDFLYNQGLYKGYYGLDFAVDIDTNQVFLLEMNARITGPTAITFMIYETQGHKFPIYLYHCAEYMGLKLNLDIEAINSQWSKPRHYESQVSLMIVKPKPQDPKYIPIHFPVSTWKLEDGKLHCLNKCFFKLSELNQGEFLFIPTTGVAFGSIITKRITQDYNFKLLENVKPIIHQFKQLRIKGKAQ